MWQKLEVQEVRPRVDRGVDWDGVRRVMARKGSREVWWRPGYSYWNGVGCPQAYERSGMILVEDLGAHPKGSSRYLFQGRLSPAKLQEHREAIAAHLGVPASELPELNPRATFVWVEP